jgi:leucyl aminopeptidase
VGRVGALLDVTAISALEASAADTVVVGLLDGEAPAPDAPDGELAGLVASGEARSAPKKCAVSHAAGKRWITVGLGARDSLDAERARQASATALALAGELGAQTVCWAAPPGVTGRELAGLVEGAVLGAYRFDRYKRSDGETPRRVTALEVLSSEDSSDAAAVVERAAVIATAQNACRDLQNAPANDMTPTALADRARALAAELAGLSVEVEGRDGILARGMGAFACVAQGTHAEPQLITLRYEGPDAAGPVLGLVGKAVTFDTGGISLKPGAKMEEMKFDMSGGAAVLEGLGAIARLGLGVKVLAVIGATENMPSGHATRPGDIVRAMNGTTIEVNNTDAEGRLVLADCLAHAVDQGAERLIDFATLTGAIVVALGSTHAGLFSDDDTWASEVEAAASDAGDLVWRMPLHPEYAEMIKGTYADIANTTTTRKASSITAAHFLERFTGGVPWAHVDIAGTAWDQGRPYTGKVGSGFGVRLITELAQRLAD